MKTYISLNFRRFIQYIKNNIYRDSKGFVGLVVAGLLALGGVCYYGAQTGTMLNKARHDQNMIPALSDEIKEAKNNPDYDPNKLYEKTKEAFDFNKTPDQPYPIDGEHEGFSSLEEEQQYYQSKYLNEKTPGDKIQLFIGKIMYYVATKDWPSEDDTSTVTLAENMGVGEKEKEFMNQIEVKKLWKMYSDEQSLKELQKWNEEDKELLFDKAQSKREDLLIEINNIIEKQKELAAEKDEIEKIGLQNYWLKKAKEKMRETGILASEETIRLRENFFKSNDFINEMENSSPPPDWLPEGIAEVEETRKWLEENDPLFSNNKLIAWLSRVDRNGLKIDPETMAEIFKNMVTGATEIAGESSSESAGDNGWTDSAQSGESVLGGAADTAAQTSETNASSAQANQTTPGTNSTATQPKETVKNTNTAAELNLSGTMTNSTGQVAQLTLNINPETQSVSGAISYSGPGPWVVFDLDENGNEVPGSRRTIMLQTTASGNINGNINMDTMTFDADLSTSYSAYWEEWNQSMDASSSTRMLGTLWEDSTASGTTADGSFWSAKPN